MAVYTLIGLFCTVRNGVNKQTNKADLMPKLKNMVVFRSHVQGV